ncbi:AGE family epimerase/isomerase [Parabacteroides sp. PF5-9]|uniref:AGE family epimerase/isomerase n=1 Tax=Parabacteroides sp. PF5-9 TaxID=1742404 RepID=UPI002473D363|nr:AGE family epimerase/isomerase [Parabacteroides sp. PF5-9]MDH6358281.1 mannobiose 2-epimerase [Parabacteroides sp. PF5-9]
MRCWIAGCLILLVQLSSCITAQDQPDKELVDEAVKDLKENILPFWLQYAPDPAGGFYGGIRNDGTPMEKVEKGGVLNARILWTFSTAYRLFGDAIYKEMADRAQHYFIRNFIDPVYGGSYWSVAADGTPANVEKQTYGIAYAVYGLAEHFRATGNKESLQQAIALYETLEKYAYDPVNGGYIESFTRDWQKPERYGYDGKGVAAKTMNTHLHVLEAYTTLYLVWKDRGLEKQLRGLIDVFTDKILDQERWHERLFLSMDWQNLEEIDSYGHDMELSWLLFEAAEVLGDETIIEKIGHIALKLVDTQMEEGRTQDGALLYERDKGEIKGGLDWWPQAEAVVAFYNAWQITKDQKYLDAAFKTWTWIKDHLIDKEFGEWYRGVMLDGSPRKSRAKADMWKCPYHNSRMGFELYVRHELLEE